jgi:hypothetical protein
MASAQGVRASLGIGTTTTITQGLEFISETLKKVRSPIPGEGLRGTRGRVNDRVRFGNNSFGGTLVLEPSPEELALLLPWMLGTNASGNVYALAETVQTRYLCKYLPEANQWLRYDGCTVSSWAIEGSNGSPLRVTLNIMAIDEVEISAPTLTHIEKPPFMFYDSNGGLDIGDGTSTLTSVPFTRFSLAGDNRCQEDRYDNASPISITPTDRIITFSTDAALTSTSYPLHDVQAAAVDIALELTFGGYALTFDMPYSRLAVDTPTIAGRSEIMLPLNFQAFRSSTNLELVTTLDSVPA